MQSEPAKALIDNVFRWVGIEQRPETFERLEVFAGFLAGEAATAGGIGPTEAGRLWQRHIGDSLTFLCGITGPRSTVEASSVIDVGSGVGLPGIPLAAALPDVRFTLLDRSERRCWLARRAARMLNLDNVSVVQADIDEHRQAVDGVVSRASLPPEQLVAAASRMAIGPAVAIVAGSHGNAPPAPLAGGRLLEVPSEVLGDTVWLHEVSLSGAMGG